MIKDSPSWNTKGAATRALLFFAIWLMVAGWKPADIPVGLFAAAAAAWVSLALLPVTGDAAALSRPTDIAFQDHARIGRRGFRHRASGVEIAT